MPSWYRNSNRREDNVAGHKYGGKTELAGMNGNIIVVIHNDTLLNAGTADMLVTFQTLCAGIGTPEGGISRERPGNVWNPSSVVA